MPDINFDCPYCKQNIDAPEDMAGTNVECPTCQRMLHIPEPVHIHYPGPRPAPRIANAPRIFTSKQTQAPEGIKQNLSPATSEEKGTTTKIDIHPEFSEPARPSRLIIIKRPGK